ncbi:MAG: DUF1549 and DUF1553 domain-containing protein [Pirellula sp.]|jgi:hypothetical protein|nr:DUF1549 and DUF1553 domain-containing protein [Pirellula sp.]
MAYSLLDTNSSFGRRPIGIHSVLLLAAWIVGGVPDRLPGQDAAPNPVNSGEIDRFIEAGWRESKNNGNSICDDAEFVRRLYLDLVGRVPSLVERESFLADDSIHKREQLIDQLLASAEHAKHLAEVYDAILIGRTSREELSKRTEAGWVEYLEESVRENKRWDRVAEEILLARSEEKLGANWYLYARKEKPEAIAEAVSKDFFGVRIDCAQCHDHPLSSEILQKHYWGLVAFFNRTKNVGPHKKPMLSESAIGGFSEFSNVEGESFPNELVFLGDRRVEEPRPAKDAKPEDSPDLYVSIDKEEYRIPKFSRRQAFIEKVLHDHPLLSKSMVNRMWGWMMGRGLVHPVDAIDSYHPASHPELLDWLSQDFAKSGYDVRRLIKGLAMSRTYQLESSTSSAADPKWFTYSIPKPLTAEMFQRSLLTVLEPKEEKKWNNRQHRTDFAKRFPDVLAEESMSNVNQSLMLTNGDWLNHLLLPDNSKWTERLISETSMSDESLLREVFLRALGREPDHEEVARLQSFLVERRDRRTRAILDLVWAVVTSAEFRFNH